MPLLIRDGTGPAGTLVTSSLPFNEWTEAFGSERLTGALLDAVVALGAPGGDRKRKAPLLA